MDIISHRKHSTVCTYFYVLESKTQRGSGFHFPCDEHGKLSDKHATSLKELLTTGKYHDDGVTKHERMHTEPAVGRCSCGRKVELYGFTNTCECGADYNMSGQELAPRCQWGEETGESLSDILSIGSLMDEDETSSELD